jgi:hypothetical protein
MFKAKSMTSLVVLKTPPSESMWGAQASRPQCSLFDKSDYLIQIMARANRHHLLGYVWHITHRCHKKEFLLKFEKDKKQWISWLFAAKKRFGLCVLKYTVT